MLTRVRLENISCTVPTRYVHKRQSVESDQSPHTLFAPLCSLCMVRATTLQVSGITPYTHSFIQLFTSTSLQQCGVVSYEIQFSSCMKEKLKFKQEDDLVLC